jgi:pilus assembly protein Flp/PilA
MPDAKGGSLFERHVRMPDLVARFVTDETGAAAMEYCLIAAGAGLAVFGAVKLIGPGLKDLFNNLASTATNVAHETYEIPFHGKLP